MATALLIEEERGTTAGYRHPHNGYYAGDFSPRVATIADTRQPHTAATASTQYRPPCQSTARIDRLFHDAG